VRQKTKDELDMNLYYVSRGWLPISRHGRLILFMLAICENNSRVMEIVNGRACLAFKEMDETGSASPSVDDTVAI